ncbi:MAG: hypothetical protein COA86_10225 [Kangiella sp.]|nr:MAG: hypothetical protein COA86_10225 [Kangiella sp.]
MNSPKLIVTEQKSNLWYISIALGCLVSLVSIYSLGRYLAVEDLSKTKQLLSEYKATLENTQIAYKQVSESLLLEKQSTLVESLSNQDLIESIQTLELEQKNMQEELRFYRNIMAPEKDAKGLNIDQLAITRMDSEGQFHFRLTIIQAQKQAQFLKGSVEITLFGHNKRIGEDKNQTNQLSYQFRELGTFKTTDFKFQFKYFQNLQGFIQLPKDFMPQRLVAIAKTKGLRKNQTAKFETLWQPEEK